MPRKARKKTRAQIERDIAKVMAATRSPADNAALARRDQIAAMTPADRLRAVRADQQTKLDRDLPWRHSYANWCTHLGQAGAKYNSRIAYGSETYDAWESGISPDAYARLHAKR